jgi:hypothetical protein
VTPTTRPTPPFSPLLVELVRADAPAQMLRDEGYTDFEVAAVRAALARTDAQHVAVGRRGAFKDARPGPAASGATGPP